MYVVATGYRGAGNDTDDDMDNDMDIEQREG